MIIQKGVCPNHSNPPGYGPDYWLLLLKKKVKMKIIYLDDAGNDKLLY